MSKNYSNMLNRLLDGNSLSEEESYKLMIAMANETISPILSGALLAGLRAKGETADEIRGFANAMRFLAIQHSTRFKHAMQYRAVACANGLRTRHNRGLGRARWFQCFRS